jgi:eukaryotic translation initiation factor 2-alpha kinase 4
LPPEYPKEPPTIEINKEAGLSEVEVADLRSEVAKKVRELLGREMIYELTQFAEEWLQRHNHKPQSFYDEMIARQLEKEKKEQELEEEQMQRAREEKEALQQMIKAELRRKEEMLKVRPNNSPLSYTHS